jgi:hypothetical protein
MSLLGRARHISRFLTMVGVGARIRRYVGRTGNMWVLVAISPNSSEDGSFNLL